MEMDMVEDVLDDIVRQVTSGALDAKEACSRVKGQSQRDEARQLILDYIWLESLVDSDDDKCRLHDFVTVLVQEGILSLKEIVSSLEPDAIPEDVYSSDMLRRKRTQAKTKRVYTIPKFNLFSECSEGYAAIVDILWSTLRYGATQEDCGRIGDQIRSCIGSYQLCPTKTISVIISLIAYGHHHPGVDSIIRVLQSIPAQGRVTQSLLFHILCEESPDPQFTGGFMKAASLLHLAQLVDIKDVWSVCSPSMTEIKSASDELMSDFNKLLDSVTKTLAGAVGTEEDQEKSVDEKMGKSIEKFSNFLRETSRFQLLVELIRSDQFEVAIPLLILLQNELGVIPVGAIDSIRDALLQHLQSLVANPETVTEEILNWIPRTLDFLGVFVGTNHLVLADMFRLSKHMGQSSIQMLGNLLLPSLSMGSPNPYLSSLAWEALSQLSPADRFRVYQAWDASFDSLFPLALVRQQTTNQTRSLLKRVVKGAQVGDIASRNSHYQFSKLCCSNPLAALRYIVSNIQIQFNYNLIEPYVEVTSKIPLLGQDVVSYLVASCLSGDIRPSLNLRTASVEPWLSNLAQYTGKFFKRHPSAPLDGIMNLIAVSMKVDENFLRAAPARVFLENIIEYMGDFSVVNQLNAEQTEALSGGPVLNSLIQASQTTNSVESVKLVERAKMALKNALLGQTGLVQTIYHCLGSQLSDLVTSQSVAQELIKGGGLKLLGILYDGTHACLLQLTEFLKQNCTQEEYLSILPQNDPLSLFKSNLDVGMSFHILRPGLRSEWTQAIADAVFFASSNVSRTMFGTFWKLTLSDISIPLSSYEKQVALLKDRILSQESVIERLEKSKDVAESKDQLRQAKRELVRLRDQSVKLETERASQIEKFNAVVGEIRSQASRWWTEGIGNKQSTLEFVSEMIYKRVFLSIQDALFCAQFVRLLVVERVPGFQLLDFFNHWTDLVAMSVTASSEGEIKNLSEFVREMMGFIVELRRNDGIFVHLVASSNPVFHRSYYAPEKGEVVPVTKPELAKAHLKWETQIVKGLKIGLSGEDWCEKRNCLVMISRTCDIFPIIHASASELVESVKALAQDGQEDIAMLALSLGRKLSSLEPNWMDRMASVPEDNKMEDVTEPVVQNDQEKTKEEYPKKQAEKRAPAREEPPESAVKRSRPADDRRERDYPTRGRNTESGRPRERVHGGRR